MTSLPTVRVSRKGADRVLGGHPWIFSSDVADRGEAQPGDVVRVADARGRALGTAHYSSTSQITLRMLGDGVEEIGREFFLRRLGEAAGFRKRVVRDSQAWRLVHGEADRLPALVVDRYGDCLVLQALSQGMDRATPLIVEALTSLFQPSSIVARNDASVRDRESLPRETGVLAGVDPGKIAVTMNGLRFHLEPLRGQKTGIFLDQRENYLAAARHGHGEALDCFSSGWRLSNCFEYSPLGQLEIGDDIRTTENLPDRNPVPRIQVRNACEVAGSRAGPQFLNPQVGTDLDQLSQLRTG
jgi:23S rRNA (cytosine1962-C5)-methyltransferase